MVQNHRRTRPPDPWVALAIMFMFFVFCGGCAALVRTMWMFIN